MSQELLTSILSPIIAVIGAFSSWLVVLFKTRSKTLETKLKKAVGVDYRDYCIYYNGKFITLSSCKLYTKEQALAYLNDKVSNPGSYIQDNTSDDTMPGGVV